METPDAVEELVDFTVHDARTNVEMVITAAPNRTRFGWSCIICGARSDGFATGADAKAAAIRHNGGAYNEA